MKSKKTKINFLLPILIITILFSISWIWEISSSASVINYSGLVRGATQNIVKQELYNVSSSNDFVDYIDTIYYDLEHGQGIFKFAKYEDEQFFIYLDELEEVWERMKEVIALSRDDPFYEDTLYALSEQHFEIANEFVFYIQEKSNSLSQMFITFYILCLCFFGMFVLISIKSTKEKEEQAQCIDPLTQLKSRHGFEKYAANHLLRRNPQKEVVIKFDITNFRRINNRLGYKMGDQILYDVANSIKMWNQHHPLVSRVNSDNFFLLVEYSDTLMNDLTSLLHSILNKYNIIPSYNKHLFTFGAYLIEQENEDIKEIMGKAMTAHRVAKNRNEVILWYNDDLIAQINTENYYIDHLSDGIKNHEFKLYLQPQVDITSLKIVSAEALVRWELKDGSIIFPDAYIHLFEENGSISLLDYYMLDLVCKYQMKQLEKNKKLIPIAINFSRISLFSPEFYEKVNQIVMQYNIPKQYIGIEILESSFNKNIDPLLNLLIKLKKEGYYILMDDFGSGYSSLGFLSKIAVHTIKLDREFLVTYDEDSSVSNILKNIIQLVNSLNMKVICEGVETKEHIELLQSLNCKVVQGYYFSKPVPSENFIETCIQIQNRKNDI